MSTIFVLFTLLFSLNRSGGAEAKGFFGVGQRIDDDQLLLKDVLHSRPGGVDEPASVSFNYNIAEPITCIEIVSEENISAEVKLSYTDTYVLGVVRLVAPSNTNQSIIDEHEFENSPNLSDAFDVTIRIFGFNQSTLNVNPAVLLSRDLPFEGQVRPYDDDAEGWEETTNATFNDQEEITDAPTEDFELKDKIIEIGERQTGDDLIYETYQTSSDDSKQPMNHTLVFYYIDSAFITYIKFVLFDHFSEKGVTYENYTAPVAEYSHYSMGTFKATITDYGIKSLFVQMFVYGYQGVDTPPLSYKPFLEPKYADPSRTVHLTPAQRLQLLLLTGRSSTAAPENFDDDSDEQSGMVAPIRPEDMLPDHDPEPSIGNAVLEQQRALPQRLYAMLGLMLFAVA